MGKRNRSKKIAPDADAKGFGHNPFAAHFGTSPDAAEEATSSPEPAPDKASPGAATLDLNRQKNLRLRVERKGRGGKTVTLIQGFSMGQIASAEDALEDLVGQLKRALSCGATLEDDTIVLQGDQRDRAARWLEDQGAKVR